MKTKQKYCRLGYLARLFNLDELIIAVSCEVFAFDHENQPLYSREKVEKLKKSLEAAKIRKKNLDNDLVARGWQICLGCGHLLPLLHRSYCADCQEKINAGSSLQS